jgi:hypothetical protein
MRTALNNLATRLDPSLILDELGIDPDPWQRRVLRSPSERMLVNCHRQSGKSTCTADLGIWTALYEPGSLILIISRSGRQAGELFRKLSGFYDTLGRPIPPVEDRADTLALRNGSRIVALPNSPDTIVGFSDPKLIILDEAARIGDDTYFDVAPMLLVSHGRMLALSTPFGCRGWWHNAWTSAEAGWERVELKASRNPRIDPAFLAGERVRLGPRWYAQNYECSFESTSDQVFDTASVQAAFTSDEPPLFGAPVAGTGPADSDEAPLFGG